MDELNRMKELIIQLNEANEAYYRESRELISNREYDALYDELLELERKTGIVLADSPTQHVGYETVTALPKKAHPSPMLSQNKTKSVDELVSFLGDQPGLLSWKMDGLTVVLHYENGSLSEAVTRGNGEVGAVVTENARTFRNIPLQIPFLGGLTLRGEAVITYPDFERINNALPEGESLYKNPRNLCSGSVLQLNSEVTAKRHVRIYPFALVDAEGISLKTHHEELEWLRRLGFEPVEYRAVLAGDLPEAAAEFASRIAGNPIPSDGLVLLMDDVAYGKSLGTTAKYPRDSIAFKWTDETAETHLLSIEWSASRTGLINPVAVFEPVELEGTVVSRASVHNVSVLEELKLGEGDLLKVYKANMIIPQIAENETRSGTFSAPASCPVCGQRTRLLDREGVRTLYCEAPDCPAKQIGRFAHFVSRSALNIDGLSEATLEKLIDVGAVKQPADLFRLERSKEKIIALEGMGERSCQNLLEAAKKASATTLSRLLTGLGIEGVGAATAKILSRHFGGDLSAVRLAAPEELCGIDGIGPVTAEAIRDFFTDEKNVKELNELLLCLTIEPETAAGETAQLTGLGFVITGSLQHFPNRETLKGRIEAAGGRVLSSVSSATTALINNNPASVTSKNRRAQELGIPILTEDEFIDRYQISPEG